MRKTWTYQFKSFSNGHLSSLVSIQERLDPSLTICSSILASCVRFVFFAENSDDGYLRGDWKLADPGTNSLWVKFYKLTPHLTLSVNVILLEGHITHFDTILVHIPINWLSWWLIQYEPKLSFLITRLTGIVDSGRLLLLILRRRIFLAPNHTQIWTFVHQLKLMLLN